MQLYLLTTAHKCNNSEYIGYIYMGNTTRIFSYISTSISEVREELQKEKQKLLNRFK